MFFEAIKYAAKSSVSRAGAWAPLPGALVVFFGLRLMGYQIAAPETETWEQGIAAFLLCAGTAWFIIFVGRLLYWPYGELHIARRRLAALSTAHLRRLIAYGRLDLIVPWNGTAPQFHGYNVGVQNVSDDTITAGLIFLNADVDGAQVVASLASSPTIISQTQGTIFQIRRTSPDDAPISMDANKITVEFEVDYDTNPRERYSQIL
jgi:hypothetical protein